MKKFIFFSFLIFTFFSFMNLTSYSSEIEKKSPEEFEKKNLTELINNLYKSTGVHEFFNPVEGKLDADRKSSMSIFNQTWGRAIMIIIAFCLFYLAIAKNFEPLLLIPIGFGGLLANIPIAEIAGPNGFVGFL